MELTQLAVKSGSLVGLPNENVTEKIGQIFLEYFALTRKADNTNYDTLNNYLPVYADKLKK